MNMNFRKTRKYKKNIKKTEEIKKKCRCYTYPPNNDVGLKKIKNTIGNINKNSKKRANSVTPLYSTKRIIYEVTHLIVIIAK